MVGAHVMGSCLLLYCQKISIYFCVTRQEMFCENSEWGILEVGFLSYGGVLQINLLAKLNKHPPV